MDAVAYREDMQKLLLVHATDSFKETVRVASLLENKAQNTAALAGVFLAAGLGFIKPENLVESSPLGSSWILLPIAVAIAGLIVTVIVCLSVLWIRDQAAPIRLGQLKAMISEVNSLSDSDLSLDLQSATRIEIVKQWTKILEKQDKTNQHKALGVALAQSALSFSILLIAFALMFVLLSVLTLRFISLFKG